MAKKKVSPFDTEKRRAFQLFKKGEFRKAALIYSKISRKLPRDFDACLMLGVISKKLGDTGSAIEWLSRATDIRNNSARAFYLLGIVYRDNNKPGPATHALQEAVRIKPDYAEACEALTGILQTEGLYHELIETCLAAVETMPDIAEFHARLAGAYERINQPARAKEAAEAALQRDAKHTRALFTLAKIARHEGNLDLAQDQLQILLRMQLSPFQLSAVAGELGEIKDRLGDFDAAFKMFEQANRAPWKYYPPHILQHNTDLHLIRNADFRS